MLADLDNNGGSCIVLASDSGSGPRSMWQLMVHPEGGSGSLLWSMVDPDWGGC